MPFIDIVQHSNVKVASQAVGLDHSQTLYQYMGRIIFRRCSTLQEILKLYALRFQSLERYRTRSCCNKKVSAQCNGSLCCFMVSVIMGSMRAVGDSFNLLEYSRLCNNPSENWTHLPSVPVHIIMFSGDGLSLRHVCALKYVVFSLYTQPRLPEFGGMTVVYE